MARRPSTSPRMGRAAIALGAGVGAGAALWALTRPSGSTPSPVLQVLPAGCLAIDTFVRPDQSGWGVASDGHVWSGGGPGLSISWSQGLVQNQASDQFPILRGVVAQDVDVLVRFSVGSRFDMAGIQARWADAGNHLLGRCDLQGNAELMAKVAGTYISLARDAVPVVPDAGYWMRLVAVGQQVCLRIWADGSNEPALPDLSATTPTAAAPGGIGLYGFASPGGAVRFGALSVVAG